MSASQPDHGSILHPKMFFACTIPDRTKFCRQLRRRINWVVLPLMAAITGELPVRIRKIQVNRFSFIRWTPICEKFPDTKLRQKDVRDLHGMDSFYGLQMSSMIPYTFLTLQILNLRSFKRSRQLLLT